MSKTLEKLIEKAEKTGKATLNGRQVERDYGYTYVGDLEEKYAIEIENNILFLRHWGTTTLRLNLETKEVIYWYGQSNSDRDSMNYVINHYGIEGKFRYRPSINEFSYIGEKKEVVDPLKYYENGLSSKDFDRKYL